MRENEPRPGLRTIMRIGRAGEQLVSYAGVTTESYRHFGRLGLGAVFGSKKLKGIVISGKRSLPVNNKKEYRQLYDEIYKTAIGSPIMKKYHDLGTAENVLPLNELGGLPTRNLREARFEGASEVSGEAFAERYLGRRLACSNCPVACIHIAALRECYEDEPYFYKTSMISYDYEPLYALGTMLGLSDAQGFLKLMDQVEKLGIDAISTGVVLAWATEAMERGIISINETASIKLSWGDHSGYIDAVKLIVEQPNEFYRALARGVEYASSVYGGKDYALALGGNEMPGYHTGPAAHAGVLTGSRHSHLDNAGYSIDQKNIGGRRPSAENLAQNLMNEERWRQILSSLVICFFARGIYEPGIVSKALHLAGFDFTVDALRQIGEDILREKYGFKIREGFSLEKLSMPKRILETEALSGRLDERYIKGVIKHIQRLMK